MKKWKTEKIQTTQTLTEQKYLKKKKMGRKTTVWIFQATNKQNLSRKNFVMAKKGKT